MQLKVVSVQAHKSKSHVRQESGLTSGFPNAKERRVRWKKRGSKFNSFRAKSEVDKRLDLSPPKSRSRR